MGLIHNIHLKVELPKLTEIVVKEGLKTIMKTKTVVHTCSEPLKGTKMNNQVVFISGYDLVCWNERCIVDS